MHEHELEIGEPLVRRLLDEQFPQRADLPLRQLDPTRKTRGTVNEIVRLGDELSVRLPRRRGPTEAGSDAAAQVKGRGGESCVEIATH
jgi:hypothetical protein